MVRVGDFSLELVEAQSKVPFKEHIGPPPHHHVYAEVEPDVEYFIRIESFSPTMTRVALKVDGVALYDTFPIQGQPKYQGFWERVNGKDIYTALRFEKSKFNQSFTSNATQPQTMWTGIVEIECYELGKASVKEDRNMSSAALSNKSTVQGKKGVASTKGRCILQDSDKKVDVKPEISNKKKLFTTYDRGPLICTVKLNYCTAVGLIANKVFVPPPPVAAVEQDKNKVKRKRKASTIADGTNERPIEL